MQEPISHARQSITTWACRDVNELYENIGKVGHGAYGEVNKARLRSDPSQIVALKKIKDESETEGFPITALREISILQQCQHPNIVKLHDIVVSKVSDSDNKRKKGSTYLVFEYMEHELLGLIDTCNLTSPQIKCIMKQMLEGLNYLHSKNIIHRDIKSANILINNKGEVKIADFGLAKKINPLSAKLTQRVVTRWYRAPELLLGSKKYTTQIDVWALGCVFAELLIGKTQALFPAQKTPDQFEVICEKCGTPDDTQWPEFKTMPLYNTMIPRKNHPRTLMQYMRKQKNNMDNWGLDLLDKMLKINPDERITAKQALEHQYFRSEPLPCDLSEMPKIEKDCHAYVLNAERKNSLNIINNNNPSHLNASNASNIKKVPLQNNKPFNQNYKNYSNPGFPQNQSYQQNRPYNHHNNNSSYRYNNRNSSTGHSNAHTHEQTNNQSNFMDMNNSMEKSHKHDPFSILSGNGPMSKESLLSTNSTSLFTNQNMSNTITTQSLNIPKEIKPDNNNKLRDQNKHPIPGSQNGEKVKRTENIHQDLFTKSHETCNQKRKASHDLDDFDQITKKIQVDPVGQNI